MPRMPSELGIVRGKGAVGERRSRIDLGLALLQIVAQPGVPLSRADLAAWCDCSESAIYLIELEILRKLRTRLQFGKDADLQELFDHLYPR